ncbi:peptidylprolyl isomerase [bacterium]|nr:peptidylprolyl isomerase [bacterium]
MQSGPGQADADRPSHQDHAYSIDEEIPLTAIIAEVNGEPIRERQVVEEAEPLLLSGGACARARTPETRLRGTPRPLLDTPSSRTLILQHTRDANIVIPNQPAKVEEAMASIRRSFASEELFQKFLYEQEMNENDLRERVLLEMKSGEFLRQKQEEQPVVVTQEEVTKYFEEHPEFFQNRLHLRVVAVYVEPGAPEAERQERRALAEMAKARLESGADFNTVAREFSDDPQGKETGGDMGFMRPDDIDPYILRAVENAPPGSILGPIESPRGYYIVRFEKRGQDLSEYNLREALAAELGEKKRAENVAAWLDRVKRSSQTKINIVHERYRKLFSADAELLTP